MGTFPITASHGATRGPASQNLPAFAALRRAFAAALERIENSRRAKAEGFVRPYLARLSDGELTARGFSAVEIAAIRQAGESGLNYMI